MVPAEVKVREELDAGFGRNGQRSACRAQQGLGAERLGRHHFSGVKGTSAPATVAGLAESTAARVAGPQQSASRTIPGIPGAQGLAPETLPKRQPQSLKRSRPLWFPL